MTVFHIANVGVPWRLRNLLLQGCALGSLTC